MTQSIVDIGKSADEIAADVRREADSVTAPKHWCDKIVGSLYTVGRLHYPFICPNCGLEACVHGRSAEWRLSPTSCSHAMDIERRAGHVLVVFVVSDP